MGLKKNLGTTLFLVLTSSFVAGAFWDGWPERTSPPEAMQGASAPSIPAQETRAGEERHALSPEITRYLILDSITLPTAQAEKILLLQILEHYRANVTNGEKAKIKQYIDYCDAVVNGWAPTSNKPDRQNSTESLEIEGNAILTMYDPRDLVVKTVKLKKEIEKDGICGRLKIRKDADFTANLQTYSLLNSKRLCDRDTDWRPQRTRGNYELYDGIFQIVKNRPPFHEVKNFFTKAGFHRVAEPYWRIIYFDYLRSAYEQNDLNHPKRFFLGQYADYLIELYPEVVHLHNYLTLGRRFNL